MTEIAARDALSDAIRYWETRRILYNTVLLHPGFEGYGSNEAT